MKQINPENRRDETGLIVGSIEWCMKKADQRGRSALPVLRMRPGAACIRESRRGMTPKNARLLPEED